MKKIIITSALVLGLVTTGTAAFADSNTQINANSQLICTPTTVTPTPSATPRPSDTSTVTTSTATVTLPGLTCKWVSPTPVATPTPAATPQPSVSSLSQNQRGYQKGQQSQHGYQQSNGNSFNSYGTPPNPMFNSPQASEQYYNNLQNQMSRQKTCYQHARRQSRNYNYGNCGSSGYNSSWSGYGNR